MKTDFAEERSRLATAKETWLRDRRLENFARRLRARILIIAIVNFIFHTAEASSGARLGGKAQALASLRDTGLNVPAWFAILPEAFEASLSNADRQTFCGTKSVEEIRSILQRLKPHEKVRAAVSHALAGLCPDGERVAVRSSAADEDSAGFSFAGQLDSFLYVCPEDVLDRVTAVWRSGFGERILAYRREHGLSLAPGPPAVLVQRMVNADVAGVAFSADPVSGRRGVAVISAIYGLGTGLVSGECDADTWRVNRDGDVLQRDIARKRMAHHFDANSPEGVKVVEVPAAEAEQPALTDDQVRAVAALARQTEKRFGRPQDIEWAMEGNCLYLLQSRPITSLAHMADPDGHRSIWDNSNIVESYSGVTTPLTFSFAHRAYEEVYRQFCRMMAVPRATIAANDQTFRQMLGLIRGRVYYNLLSWYRVLAMLPGFTVNRRFMEQMMGVKEGLPEELLADFSGAQWTERIKDALRLAVTMGGLILNLILLPRRIRQFYIRLHTALAPPKPPLEQLRPDELATYYHSLEKQLLTRWDAPLVNDFFAMIFYGVLRKVSEKWCGDKEGTLQNNLLCGEGDMISAEPAQRIREMAQLAAKNPDLASLLCQGSLPAIGKALDEQPEFKARYQAYLEKFGDRCLEELKLESTTLHDDPLLLLRSVGQLASSGKAQQPSSVSSNLRAEAERQVAHALRGHPIRRGIFQWVLIQTRARVRHRENLRFERTRLFGRVRRVFVELGRRLHARDLLQEPRDIFYLEVNELLGFVEGTTTSTNLRALVELRKSEFAAYREEDPPSSRFETRGMVHHGNTFKKANAGVHVVGGDQRKGIGCCPGIVRGPVRVITDPRNAVLESGAILVAERTDPGWIILFPFAAGLLVERGSLLSHSAIVAREMGIPAIVSIDGVTQWLHDGDRVELDGSAGVVRKIGLSS